MYIFIVNPIAGDGKAKRIFRRIQGLEEYQNIETEHYITQYPGHAIEIIKQIEMEFEEGKAIQAVIVIGGDGTMHEVINGLTNKEIPMGYIPGGSGNDFARGAEISTDYVKVLNDVIHNSTQKFYWLGSFAGENGATNNFVNCIGFGFDAVVAKGANSVPFRKVFNKLGLGTLIYLVSLIRGLISYKPLELTLELDGVKHIYEEAFLITINNNSYLGGGMKINPLAKNNGEHLSVLVIESISKWKVLGLFLTVFTGGHLKFKETSTFDAKQIEIYANSPLPYQADGEYGETSYAKMTNNPEPMRLKGATGR
ncbi:MAG: diacylglycerol kinase family lipid kinase [Clostridiales bacterium]|nr:diacylglycerol kinase family lipid kinase [Clostridiales bacterium]